MAEGTCGVEGCGAKIRCKDLCRSHYQRAWYERNRDAARVYARAHYDSTKAAEAHAAKKADAGYQATRKASYNRWRTEHPDRAAAATRVWREKRREHVRAVNRAWTEANRETLRIKRRNYGRARRLRMSGAGVDYAAILVQHGMTCHICCRDIESMADLHFDHVIPLARGGEHVATNIRPAHATCNMRKGARVTA